MNTQDGELIVIGVKDSTLEPIGLSDADFTSLDTTKVNCFHRYTDPQASCEGQKLTLESRKLA